MGGGLLWARHQDNTMEELCGMTTSVVGNNQRMHTIDKQSNIRL